MVIFAQRGQFVARNPDSSSPFFSQLVKLKQELVKHVRGEIGSFASPDIVQWASGLPKTRSGKIMRRILRKIAINEIDNLGDTSTLAEPEVVNNLIENRENK